MKRMKAVGYTGCVDLCIQPDGNKKIQQGEQQKFNKDRYKIRRRLFAERFSQNQLLNDRVQEEDIWAATPSQAHQIRNRCTSLNSCSMVWICLMMASMPVSRPIYHIRCPKDANPSATRNPGLWPSVPLRPGDIDIIYLVPFCRFLQTRLKASISAAICFRSLPSAKGVTPNPEYSAKIPGNLYCSRTVLHVAINAQTPVQTLLSCVRGTGCLHRLARIPHHIDRENAFG